MVYLSLSHSLRGYLLLAFFRSWGRFRWMWTVMITWLGDLFLWCGRTPFWRLLGHRGQKAAYAAALWSYTSSQHIFILWGNRTFLPRFFLLRVNSTGFLNWLLWSSFRTKIDEWLDLRSLDRVVFDMYIQTNFMWLQIYCTNIQKNTEFYLYLNLKKSIKMIHTYVIYIYI